MAQTRIVSGELANVAPFLGDLRSRKTTALLKAQQLELVRIVLLAGSSMPEHQVHGEITFLCIEGAIAFGLGSDELLLRSGDLLHLKAGERHSLTAFEDS
ncbi:MAG: hypothetical protein JWQ73_3751, partial [Variovorax sp.]|nr:hypothetical protein [Variovorax sp.]